MSSVWRAFVGFAVFAVTTCRDAALVSYDLDQSNELPDGHAYLRVTIDDQGLAGRINFNVSVLSPLLTIADQNFGLQKFGFNSKFSLSSANVVGLPGNWRYDDSGNMSGFGRYDALVEANTGNARLRTLSFSISGISRDTMSSYLLPSSGHAGNGNFFFAAHVGGFNFPGDYCVTSAYIAGSMPSSPAAVPLPASAWLLMAGLGVLAFAVRRGSAQVRSFFAIRHCARQTRT